MQGLGRMGKGVGVVYGEIYVDGWRVPAVLPHPSAI
jgi:hypothetical protein